MPPIDVGSFIIPLWISVPLKSNLDIVRNLGAISSNSIGIVSPNFWCKSSVGFLGSGFSYGNDDEIGSVNFWSDLALNIFNRNLVNYI